MTCRGCGYAAAPDFAFCPRCGSKLAVACPGCGAPTMPGFAFCPRCGTPVSGTPPAPDTSPSPEPLRGVRPAGRSGARDTDATPSGAGLDGDPAEESDRRHVTVLFADVSGFTTLSEGLDPEDVRALQNELFAALSAAIEQYGGFVEKYVGDAVMAVFGAPVAHEDDPERALRTALAMLERTEAVDRAWSPRIGHRLRLHIGVHTGPVVAGTMGSRGHAAYAVTGDTVNTAARLQSTAAPGQIVVSQATQRLTHHAFVFEALAPVGVKGKRDPVPVHLLRGLQARRVVPRGLESHGLSSPLVGRDDELAQLVAAFERARRGRAQVVSLIGEAGQGKSRLVTELLGDLERQAALAPVAVRRVTCPSLGAQTYGVFAGFVREGYGITPEDTLEVARAKVASGARAMGMDLDEVSLLEPMLGPVLGLVDRPAHDTEPAMLRKQIFSAARVLVEQRLRQGPLVLVVEDLHWADEASSELLRHLVDRLPDRALLVILTHRPSFDPRGLVTTRATHTAIRLASLLDRDIEHLLETLLGPAVADWPPQLRSLVITRAGGNPLYLEEIIRSMIGSDQLRRTERGWVCTGKCASVEIPPTIQGLIAARLDQVSGEARRLLQEAAVLGPTFDLDLLRDVTSRSSPLESTLETLVERELLEEAPTPGEPGRRWRFAHALLHTVAYENLLLSRRTALHGAAAEALLARLGTEPQRLEDLETLAHHFARSATRHRAAGYLIQAGDRARAIYANADAVRHYEQALDVLPDGASDEGQILAVRERLGDLFGPMGRRDAALEHYAAVRAAGEAAGRPAEVARLLRKIGGLHWEAGERDAALRCFHSGLALLESEPDRIERAHLYQELGRCAFRAGDHHAALTWAERALAVAEHLIDAPGVERLEAAAALSHACNTRGIALARMQRLDDAVRSIERSVTVAESYGLLPAAGRGYANLGVVYAALDARRGIATSQRGLEIAKRIGDFGLQSRLYANLAVGYCALTERCDEQGIEAASASIRLDRELDQRDHLAIPLIVLGQIYQCQGQQDLAHQHYREALALAEETGEPQLLFPCYDGLATLRLDAGDEAEAERYLTLAQGVCERSGLHPDALIVLPFLI